MKKMYKSISLLLILVTVSLFSFHEKKKVSGQPNIVVILCDDLGYGDLSSYGHPVIETPNLDKMASQGMKFSNFYSAAPVCSPSRVGLYTGRSPNRAGVYDFIIGGQKQRPDNRDMVHLQAHEETISSRLKSVGYATCLSGKWHCSSLFNSEEQPTPDHFGFDHWFATHNNAAPSHENPNNFVRNGENLGEIEGYSCQIVVDEAVSWLETKEKDQPFYLQIAFHEPHEPVASPQDLVDKYLPMAENLKQAEYFANVANVDLAVGRLMEYIEKNYGENTLVIFTSDNGPETLDRYPKASRSYGSPGDLKGMKLWTNEAGFRVPGIIYWMGQKGYSGNSDAVVSSLDFMPTFCELAGAELPDRELDGESIVPLLKSGKFDRKTPLLWSFYNALNDQVVAMRDGDWKILARLKMDNDYLPKIQNVYTGNEDSVRQASLTDFELYHMKNDKEEAIDLAGKNTKDLRRMKKLLESEYQKLLDDSHIWTRD
ncbi:arylsulfatase [Echinicola pacifica]|uniref:Arylsulfatase n=1 Tax=Echinicola pacifica TaxID=346377 RepID=A0A918PKJ6_9BACT|nr:sulfatase-like hydrolase/transferase [Echinicola pacifica]GGZ13633.1 arylsulfatase [Echinicola pacifica]